MKNLSTLLFAWLFSLMVLAQPTDNPVATYYNGNDGYPAWTDNIKWNNVIDMSTYSNGTNDFEKFENARDELYAQGGGVLYYPGGTYDFSDAPLDGPDGRGLMLRSGVVIRGEAPSTDDYARSGNLSLSTKFVFPFNDIIQSTVKVGEVPKDWNMIGLMPESGQGVDEVDNVGICWVNTVGAYIYFGAELNWTANYGSSGSWYYSITKSEDRNGYNWKTRVADGTHPIDPFAGGGNDYIGAGSGRLIFGCKLEDAAVINNALDYGNESTIKLNSVSSPTPNKDFFYTYKFGSRISVHGEHVFVANNVIPKSSKNFLYSQTMCLLNNQANASVCEKNCYEISAQTTIFDYARQHGVDVNKDLLGFYSAATPDSFGRTESPGLYEDDVVVKDNWIFNHGHKGYNVSGEWVVVKNNRNERIYLQQGDTVYGLGTGWIISTNGFLQTAMGNGCISENFSRAFDMAGQSGWVDHNSYENTGSSPGCDGEGILWQHHGGTQFNSFAVTNNIQTEQVGFGCGTPGAGYMAAWDVNVAGGFFAWDTTSEFIGYTAIKDYNVKKEYDAAVVDPFNTALGGTKINNASGDVIDNCPTGTPTAPTIDAVEVSSDSTYVRIAYTDNTDNEVAYRIDRSIGNNSDWETIVYRPRQNYGHIQNLPEWHDYLAPRGVDLYYRVVAINCSNDESGSVEYPSPVVVPQKSTSTKINNVYKDFIVNIYPVPAVSFIKTEVERGKGSLISMDICSVDGKVLISKQIGNSTTTDISNLKSGVYIVKFSNGQNIKYSKIVVK